MIILTGCVASEEDVASEELQLPEKNVDQWVLPLDPYMLPSLDNSDYAENLLIQECMEKRGHEWTIPSRDVNSNWGKSFNGVLTRLFNTKLASEWGYHLAPASDQSILSLRQFNIEHSDISSTASNDFDDCLAFSRESVPLITGSMQVGAGLAQAANEKAKTAKPVLESSKKWRECMAPVGVPDLPQDPQLMPADSLRNRFQIEEAISPVTPTVSSEEIQVASADAECRVSSGFRDALYDAQWNNQLAEVEGNADALLRAQGEIQRREATVLRVISDNIPNG